MNERIRELATEAEFSEKDLHIQGDNFQRFAQLIVQECVGQIEIEKGNPYRNMGDQNGYGIGACVESIRRIKEHFGVES